LSVAERAAALAAAILIAPVAIPVMLAVRFLSGRTPLIAHQRCGLNGELFWMLKIRTMWNDRGRKESPGWIERIADTAVPIRKDAPDPRVTSRFARFLRRFSIDELPQLGHIVTGRMRFVGPRPLTAEELETYYGAAAIEVLRVLPGLTGLWQIMGRNRLTYAQRRRLDLFLVRRNSIALYFRILAATPVRVLSGRDAW
jgi:exopolysaccharide production protein ExoY